jgi:L-alanine-DL-glutamate epimerase-like enolase superfamily enzyme
MRISGCQVTLLHLPADEPLVGAVTGAARFRPTVLLQLQTDGGVEGLGFTFLGAGLSRALKVAVEDMIAICVGMDVSQPEAITRKLYDAAGGSGPAGIFTLALAAIDMALWDIRGKVADAPLWKLLGASGAPVPTYASGALMRDLTLDAAIASADRLVDAGYRQVKMQLALPGSTTPDLEIERARKIRECLGPNVMLMCDINQRWSVEEAISLGRRLEEFDLAWLEDPTAHDDLHGLARIAGALSMPVAVGEYVYGLKPFEHLIEAGAVDIVMIDPFRVGGITQWLKAAALADGHDRKVVSHLAPEVQVHLIGAVPNGMTVEFMPWSCAMFRNPPWPRDGVLDMPTGPGLGLELDRDAVRRFGA